MYTNFRSNIDWQEMEKIVHKAYYHFYYDEERDYLEKTYVKYWIKKFLRLKVEMCTVFSKFR